MRISGGRARGIHLLIPEEKSFRPTTDALREAIFSVLGNRVVGANFIDFCAGIGSYGLEALSRGAKGGIFLEKNGKFCPFIRKNLINVAKSAGVDQQACQIMCGDIFKRDLRTLTPASLIFLDPPYDAFRKNMVEFMAILETLLHDDSIGVLELPSDAVPQLPVGLICSHVIGKTRGKDSPKAFILRRIEVTLRRG
jgi:16S rRNA (guanine966-N2)-methyltransferase